MDKKRVLIVDDTQANILILNDILKGMYNISVATNGKDALKIANSTPRPDLILLDIVMPGMDGYEVTRRLKNNNLTSSIPVIYVTSKDNEEDESKGFELGCVDYLTKPVNPPIVLARVKTHLELSHAFETLEIQNKELVQAAKLRDDIEEITRHDLKNPLTGIFSAVDIMEMIGDLSDAQNEALEIMKSSANKMISMVNTSLYLYKMERNIYNLESTDINIIDIITRIVKEFDSIFKRYKTSVSLFVNDKPVSGEDVFNIKGEMLLFYSMIANLIRNAAEANSENEIITVLLNKKDSTSFIAVKNKGTVPKEIHKTFFDKFATSGKRRGTGLGTYSAKMITKTLGGEISMESSKKDGTTILISFPD